MMSMAAPSSRRISLISGPNASVSRCATPAVGSSRHSTRASSASKPGELDDPAGAGREIGDAAVGVATEPEEGDELVGLRPRRARSRAERRRQEQRGRQEARAATGLERDLHRLAHRQLGEEARGLERPPEARAGAPARDRSPRRRRRGVARCPSPRTNPPIAFISVDFPAPLVPMSPTISSLPTSSDTSSTATMPPNRTATSATSSAGTPPARGRPRGPLEHRRCPATRGRRRHAGRGRAAQPNSASRTTYASWIEARRGSTAGAEQPDARREQRHQLVVGEERGQADDPERAEHRAHRRGDAADHDERHEGERVRDQEEALRERHGLDRAGRAARHRARRGTRRSRTHGASWTPAPRCTPRRGRRCRAPRSSCDRCRSGAGGSRTTTAHDEHGEHDVVVGALRREVEPEERASAERHRPVWPSERTGWRYRYCCAATANANVLTASSSPRTRSAPSPMSAASRGRRTPRARSRAGSGRPGRSASVDDSRGRRSRPRVSAAASERAEAGERHLAERELAGPSGEDGERQPADREHDRWWRRADGGRLR